MVADLECFQVSLANVVVLLECYVFISCTQGCCNRVYSVNVKFYKLLILEDP